MYDVLSGMRILELSAFIAAPLAGLTLSQLGAELFGLILKVAEWITSDGH